jgi:ABC-type glycerol-3-phosphate transport system substrate-binding protein
MNTSRPGARSGTLALLASLAIVASACSGGSSSPAASAPAASGAAPSTAGSEAPASQAASGGTPVVWIFEGPEGQALKAAGAEYTKQTGKPVDVQVLGRDTFNQKRDLFIASQATGVDLIMTGSSRVPSWADGQLIAPVEQYINAGTDYQWESDVFPVARAEAEFGGHLYMFPLDTYAEILVYRKDLIQSPPTTWDDYRTVAMQFTKSVTPASPTKYGTAYSGKDYVPEASWFSVLWGYGGDMLDPSGKVVIDSPEAVASLDYHLGLLLRDHVVPPETPNWEYPEIQIALQQGLLAMASHFPAAMPELEDCTKSPNTCGKVAIAPLPGGTAGQFSAAENLGLVMNPKAENAQAAADFAMWVSGPEGGKIYTRAGGATPRRSVYADPEVIAARPWNPDFAKTLESAKGTIRSPKASDLLTALRAELNKALAGQQDAKTTLDNTAAEWRKILGQ